MKNVGSFCPWSSLHDLIHSVPYQKQTMQHAYVRLSALSDPLHKWKSFATTVVLIIFTEVIIIIQKWKYFLIFGWVFALNKYFTLISDQNLYLLTELDDDNIFKTWGNVYILWIQNSFKPKQNLKKYLHMYNTMCTLCLYWKVCFAAYLSVILSMSQNCHMKEISYATPCKKISNNVECSWQNGT